MKMQTFSPSLINSDSLAPWAFRLSAAPAISGSVNWGQGCGWASGNSRDSAEGGGTCRLLEGRLQPWLPGPLPPLSQAACSSSPTLWLPLRSAGAKGFQTVGPRPLGLNCTNAQSRGGCPACPREQSRPVLTACFPPAAPPFHLGLFPRDARGSFPGDRHVLSNLLPSSLVSLVLCIPLSPLWFKSPIPCSYPVLMLDCVGEGFEKQRLICQFLLLICVLS